RGFHVTGVQTCALPIFARLGGDAGAAVRPSIQRSWIWDELYRVRNIRPSFRFGLWGGLAYSAVDTFLLRGRAPWTFHHHPDHTQIGRASCRERGTIAGV